MRHHPHRIVPPAAVLLAATLTCTLTASAATLETMDGRTTVVSVRAFAAGVTQHADLTVEAAFVTVPDDAAWDGGEQLDVPHTESPAEREQREREEQKQAEAQQAAEQRARAASRSALRATLPDGWDSNAVLTEASKYLGVPYVYGGSSPSGFDCSGLVQYVYAQLGVSLPRTDGAQRAWAQANGTQVSAADAQPGDLMWMPGHVGIYAGDGMILHAPTPGDVVRVQNASYATFEYYRIG